MNKNDVFLLLGANLGHRTVALQTAANHIEAQIAPIVSRSKIYETAPWGLTEQPAFLNQVVHLQTVLHPIDVLERSLKIEQQMGRERGQRWAARTIDIDLLYCGTVILKMAHLTVPHPRLHERRFTLIPLTELAPNFTHPVLKKTHQELLAICTDTGQVSVYEEGN